MTETGNDGLVSTLGLAGRAVLGFAVVVTILAVNARGSQESRTFIGHGEAVFWILLFGAQGGFWFSVTSYAWRQARKYVHGHRDVERVAGSIAVLLLLLIGVPVAARAFGVRLNPIWGAAWKMPMLIAIAFVSVALPCFLGILGIQALALRSMGRPTQDRDIERYTQLQDDLNRFLILLGTTIGLGVLATGALRNAVLIANDKADFPPEAILEYGGFLTIVLVFAYAPAHYAVKQMGIRIRHALLPRRPTVDSDDFASWYSTRTVLTDLLQLDVGIYQRLQTAIFVLAPLVSAALSVVIPKSG